MGHCMPEYNGGFEKKCLCDCMNFELTPPFPIEHYFHLKNGWQTMVRLWHLTDIFSEISGLRLSLQGKWLTVFVANNRIWALKRKLKFWKICIYHCDLDSFPILKKTSDEISVDTVSSEMYFLILSNEINIRKIYITQRTVFSKWPMCDVIKYIWKRSIQSRR